VDTRLVRSATVSAMPLAISGKQLNKLGERLASPEPITDDDYALLGQVAEEYQAVLDKVEEQLQGLGYQATTRVIPEGAGPCQRGGFAGVLAAFGRA
jgi:hypothetical protein